MTEVYVIKALPREDYRQTIHLVCDKLGGKKISKWYEPLTYDDPISVLEFKSRKAAMKHLEDLVHPNKMKNYFEISKVIKYD